MSNVNKSRKTRHSRGRPPFERYAVTLPNTLKPRPDRGKIEAGQSLTSESLPFAMRSAAIIDRTRRGLKLAIKALRGSLTQQEFASRIGITQAALARMESLNNDVFPSTPLLIRIALVSGVDLRISFLKPRMNPTGIARPLAHPTGFPSLTASEGNEVVIERDLQIASGLSAELEPLAQAAFEKR